MTKTQSRASFALFVLFASNLLNFFNCQLLGALAQPIRKEFQLSDTALGLLGTVATLIYALVGLPFGRLTDRWHRTRLIAIGTVAWSVLTAASALAQNYACRRRSEITLRRRARIANHALDHPVGLFS